MRRAAFAIALAGLLAAAGGARAQEDAPPPVPEGPGAISGRVELGAAGTPIADAEVVLYALSPDGPGLARTRSDADGRYRFEHLSVSPDVAWLVGARYEGVAFPGGRVRFEGGAHEAELAVVVSPLTRDGSGLRVGALEVQLARAASGVRVMETVHIENPGEATWYVPAAARASATSPLRFALPAGADDFQMPLGVVPEGIARDGDRITYWGPLYPGDQELSFSYVVAAPAGGAPLDLALDLPTGASSVRVQAPQHGLTVSGKGLVEEASPEPPTAASPNPHVAPAPPLRSLRGPAVARGGALGLRIALEAAQPPGDAVKLDEVRVVVQVDDAALDVTETYQATLGGDAPVLGSADEPLLRLPLPEGLSRLRFGSDAQDVTLLPDDEGALLAVGLVPPGPLAVEVRYQLPVADGEAALALRVGETTPVLSVFVADNGRLEPRSTRLHQRRPFRTSDLTYLHLEAFQVEPEETVDLELGVLPPRHGPPPAVLRAATLALSALVLGLVTLPLWRGARGGAGAAAGEVRQSAAERERLSLYQAIRDLDDDFETGKLSAEDHDRMRAELRARAAALLAAEAAQPERAA